ncbi:MAG: SDR family oxidoreductase [Bacteroidetes bacterium]|nr:SDR family oxidoreductase [Bacteroidota bacterium]
MDKERAGIWITGANSGIGKATVKEFVSVGCNVFASARRVSELNRLTENDSESQIGIYPCNVASRANVDQTFKKISAEYNINCLINNAGITSFKSVEENSVKEIDEVINTNLLGSIYTIKAVLPHFIKISGGTIINVLSIVTEKTFTNSSVYSASKMGLLGYARVLREEVRKYNIRVINVIPGVTETPIWTREMREENSERMMNPESIARLMVSAFLQSDNLVTEEIVVRPIQGDL